MARKSGLGKGLDALIPPAESALPSGGVAQIAVGNIVPNPRQPRSNFDTEELDELAASIREHGVIQPLVVKQGETEGRYTLIAGERRLQAARRAGLTQVPAVIREADGQQLLEIALIENVQRADLGPLEAAEAFQQLKDEFGLSDEAIAARVGKSRVAITNTRTLLELSNPVKTALAEGKITEGHARALKGRATAKAQQAALETVLNQGLNVRQTEELVRRLNGQKSSPKPAVKNPPEIRDLESRLEDSLATKVSLKYSPTGGLITIRYYSDEELNALVDKLTGG
jgi:ParB family chromosome partitioning protein